MRCFIRVLLVLITAVIILLGALFLFTKPDVRVERSVVMQAPPEKIFPLINNLEATLAWSPWKEMDPEMKVTFEGPESGVGAISRWESETQGTGSQTITASVPNESLVTALDFGPMGKATSDWTLKPAEDGGTEVVWGMVSHNGYHPGFRLFGLFMDGLLGPQFEKGLANLKALVEEKAP